MKKFLFGIITPIFLIIISCDKNDSEVTNEDGLNGEISTVDQNGNTFSIASIGNQTWMTENLNVDKFRNGDVIMQATSFAEWQTAISNQQPAWCYINFRSSNGAIYKKIYNWYAVIDLRGLAPEGWHIPNDNEWWTLVNYLGGKEVAGKKMKTVSGWDAWCTPGSGGTTSCYGPNANTNESGFSALPGGFIHPGANGIYSFLRFKMMANFWSRSANNASWAVNAAIGSNNDAFFDNFSYWEEREYYGFYVRCIAD